MPVFTQIGTTISYKNTSLQNNIVNRLTRVQFCIYFKENRVLQSKFKSLYLVVIRENSQSCAFTILIVVSYPNETAPQIRFHQV